MGNDSLNDTVNAPKWQKVWEDHLKKNPGQTMKFEVPVPSEVVKDENFKENFLMFRRKFLHYLHLTQMVSLPEIVQVEQLLTLIGPACNRILDNLDLLEEEKNTVDKVFEALEKTISAAENPVEWEMKLLDVKQEPSETILDYVDRIRELAKKAGLKADTKVKLIAMKFMHGLRCAKTRAKIVKKRLTALQDMIDEATAQTTVDESDMAANQTVMAMGSAPYRGYSPRTQTKRGAYGRSQSRGGYQAAGGQNKSGYSNSNRNSGQICGKCGGKHYPNQECPARNRRCDFCKQMGHYKKVCRQVNEISENDENEQEEEEEIVGVIDTVSQTHYDRSEFLYTINGEGEKRVKAFTNVRIRSLNGNWMTVRVLADTGAFTAAKNINKIAEFGIKRESLKADGLPVVGFGQGTLH